MSIKTVRLGDLLRFTRTCFKWDGSGQARPAGEQTVDAKVIGVTKNGVKVKVAVEGACGYTTPAHGTKINIDPADLFGLAGSRRKVWGACKLQRWDEKEGVENTNPVLFSKDVMEESYRMEAVRKSDIYNVHHTEWNDNIKRAVHDDAVREGNKVSP
jgi:hypothetical protein